MAQQQIKQTSRGKQTLEKTSILWLLLCTAIACFFFLTFRRRRNRRQENTHDDDQLGKDGRTNRKKPMISLCVNRLLFSLIGKDRAEILPESKKPFLELCDFAELYVFAKVESDEEEESIRRGLIEAGALEGGLLPHRIMFSLTTAGRACMVRQLQPLTHIDSEEEVITALQGKVPNVVYVCPLPRGDDADSGTPPPSDGALTSLLACVDLLKAAAIASVNI